MNGLQFVAALRRQGIRPQSVRIDAVTRKPLPAWYSGTSVHAEIGPDESIADMDFRPLVGLSVHLGGADLKRVRRVAKRAAEVKPALLCVYRDDETGFTLDRLWADGRTDRRSL
jgi:hypothetical protein